MKPKKVSAAATWLKENDPTWVAPAEKAAQTKTIPVSHEMLSELSGGNVMRKIGGVWRSVSPIALAGDAESGYTREAIDGKPLADATTKSVILKRSNRGKRRRGKRGGKGR